MTTVANIIHCLKYDGYTAEQGAAYCKRIAQCAERGAFTDKRDAENYIEAARVLEAEALSLKLSVDRVTRLEEANQHLLKRVFELEQTIVKLTAQ